MIKKLIYLFTFLVILSIIILTLNRNSDVLEIHIGYQSVTSQTWSALIIKNKKIFEKKLEREYPDMKIRVVWHDEISGSVINTSMLSNKIDIGFMGDMPLILNMYKAHTLKDYNSKLVAIDGIGKNGLNQSIVVPIDSEISKIEDLKNKTISTPIGSSAHFMLMKVLKEYDLVDTVEIVHQDVAMANQLLSNNKIDAFSIWEPYPTLLINSNVAKKIVDGTESQTDYLAGVIVNKKWYDENHSIANLFIESLDEAHEFIKSNPDEAANIFSDESGFDYDITFDVINNIKWESKINDSIIENLKEKKEFLIEIGQIKEFDLNENI